MTTQMPGPLGYMRQVDGLRFIAAVAVMLTHFTFGRPFHIYFANGAAMGVNLFFVLSGFLISQILIENKKAGYSLRQFYIRRVLRIFPLYFLVVFASIALDVPEARAYFPWLATYTANIPAGLWQGKLKFLEHLWSLSVEEQFYLFFPFLISIIPDTYQLRLFKIIVVISVLSRFFCIWLIPNRELAESIAYTFTPCCFDSFALGAILAHYRLSNPAGMQRILSKNYLFAACGLACVIIPVLLNYDILPWLLSPLFRMVLSIFSIWIIGKASMNDFSGLPGAFLDNRIVIYLGKISYGIYVYHYFMPYIFSYLGHVPYSRLYYIPATIAISALSWHLFEKPINNLKRHFNYGRRIA